MKKYHNAEDQFEKLKNKNSELLDIVYQVISGLELIHESGYIFNNLKPENIIIQKVDLLDINQVTLISHNSVFKYLDKNGKHIEHEPYSRHVENQNDKMLFKSLNFLEGRTLS